MGIAIQRRRGTTIQHSSFTGKVGEMTVDTTKWVVVVHDGSTVGGYAMSRADHTHPNATTSTPGFMSATDKTKLDGITGGSLSYQTLQANGADQTQRGKENFTANFTLTDDGAGNRTSIDLSDSGVGAGSYTKLTVNTKGRVTSATLLSAGDIPLLTASKISDFSTAAQTVRLDQFAAPTSDVSLNSHKIINLADPVSATDAATKQYVDTTATGLTFKAACRVASTTNVNLASPGLTIDTINLNLGDRILLKDQSDQTQNGIYNFNGSTSPLSRSLDANSNVEVKSGMFVLVTEGNVNSEIGFVLATDGAINLGSTNLSFVPFSSGSGSVTAGNGINVSGSVVSVKTASSSRIAVGGGGVDLAVIGGLTPGTYQQFTVDAYGRITATTSNQWQPLDSGLTAIAGLGVNGFVYRTGAGSYASRTLQAGTGIALSNDGSTGNPGISVTPDTTKQQVLVSLGGSTIGTRSQINFIQGSGATLTVADNSGSNRVDVTVAASGGGGGAPTTAQYVTLANDATLTNERALVNGVGISMVDGGANGNVTLSLITDLGSVP
jgi:Major tropism determinant N-terminal domain